MSQKGNGAVKGCILLPFTTESHHRYHGMQLQSLFQKIKKQTFITHGYEPG